MSDRARRNAVLLRELSPADAQLAKRALDQDEKRRRKDLDARTKELDKAREDAARQLRDLVGKNDWLSLRRQMREGRIEMRDLLQPPDGLKRDRTRVNTARKRKADALLTALGISRDKLAKIGSAFQQRVQKIAPPRAIEAPGFHTAGNLSRWTKLSPFHVAPLPWGVLPPLDDPNDPHRWFLFKPPFFDWPSRFEAVESDGFEITRVQNCYGFAGYVGHDVTMRLGDADSFDFGQAIVDTRMGFIFDILANGRVEILIDASNASGTHDLSTEDEFGWSETFTNQTNFLSAQVLHPNVSDPLLAPMSNLFSTDISTTIHHEVLIPGEHYFTHFITAGTVTAGQSVVILVGTHNFEKCACNDTGYASDTSFHWLIRSVEVRVRP